MDVTFTQDKSHPMLTEFPAYLNDWQQLSREYDKIPSWRFIKQMRNIRQREKLTKAYTKRMKEWGIT